MVGIEPDGGENQLPGFSVLLAIVFMVICLGAFIYFIHSISQEIQVHNIMQRLFDEAKNRLDQLINSEKDSNQKFPDTDNWTVYKSPETGFLQDIVLDPIIQFAKENNNQFEIITIKGQYVYKDKPLFKSKTKLNDESLEELFKYFHFSRDEIIEDNYVLGFKQITEIAVKAMSPGINDPGTTIIAIDYLAELFQIRMYKNDISILFEDSQPLVKINSVTFKELLYFVLAPIRTYAKHDVIIVNKLINMFQHLAFNIDCDNKGYLSDINKEVKLLSIDANSAINNQEDLKYINNRLQSFNL